jgi:hypothetical protein
MKSLFLFALAVSFFMLCGIFGRKMQNFGSVSTVFIMGIFSAPAIAAQSPAKKKIRKIP